MACTLTRSSHRRARPYYADESPAFLPTCHLVINDCYDPHLNSLKLWHAQTGISHVTTNVPSGGQGPQGFYMADVRCTVFKTCLVHSQTYTGGGTVQCPDGMIQNCYFQFRDVGLDLTSVLQWQVSGCEFYNVGDGGNVGGDCLQLVACDVRVADADTVNITGCRFNRTNATSAPNRVNIQVNTNTPPSGSSTKRFLIAHNQFGDQVAGGGNFGISAVQVLGTASDVQIGHNDYIGAYSASIVNDQSGTGAVVAMLGYPGSATNPSAVVPNGGASGVLPTIGSAAVPWPQSFSLGHYVQRVAANPTFPGGTWQGWVIYTDHTSGNLVAYKGSGTPTTLAS